MITRNCFQSSRMTSAAAARHKTVARILRTSRDRPREMSDLFLLVMQVLRDHAVDGLQAELEDHKRQWNSLMTFRVIQNPVWNDAEDVPRVVHASGLVLSEHAIAVEVPRSDGTIRMKFHSWLVPMVGRCKISDLMNCQMEFLGVAEKLEVDASSLEWIPDQEDAIRVNLCVCDRQWGYYNTQSYVGCRICGLTNLREEVERMTRHREFYESGASRRGR